MGERERERLRQRALLHEHIVALCAIIVAIMARQLSVFGAGLEFNSETETERSRDFRDYCVHAYLLTFWARAINNTPPKR